MSFVLHPNRCCPPSCPYLTQLVTVSIARFRAQLSLDKDSSFPSTAVASPSTAVAVMTAVAFPTAVAVMMPPFCPYLTQLVTDSIARFRAQLSLDKDSSSPPLPLLLPLLPLL
ncbi:hypothetical protein GEMRC1_008002 [Eukaryota sp. GEM-RC1]